MAIHTLSTLVELCVKHDVDFEVYHGQSTNKGSGSRATMLLDFSPKPSIRIDFGDKKHGQRVSRIHVANNHHLTVKLEDVLKSIEGNEVVNDWRTQAAGTSDDVVAVLRNGINEGSVSVNGKVVDGAKLVEKEEQIFLTFTLAVPHFTRNTITGDVHKHEDVIINVEYKLPEGRTPESMESTLNYLNQEDARSYAEGMFIYPNILRSNLIGSSTD